MHILDRIILAFYTILLAAASVLTICFSVGLLPVDLALEQLRLMAGRWEVVAGAGILFLVSVRLLLAGLGGEPKELTLSVNEGGQVRISMAAVRKFVEKSGSQVKGVHNVKARVLAKGDNLKIELTAGVLPEMNVPITSKNLQEKIKNSVKETIGRDVADVHITFNTISYDAKNKQG